MSRIPTHPCTAWCNRDSHVDLVHANADRFTSNEIGAATVRDYRKLGLNIRITCVEPAREARQSPEPTDRTKSREGHLVWWEVVR